MAACAGVQNVSRPIERCQEMSQMMPTFALVAATSVAATYQGTGAASGAAGAAGVAAPPLALGAVTRAAGDQAFAAPLLEDLLHLLVRVVQRLPGGPAARPRLGAPGGEHARVETLARRRG